MLKAKRMTFLIISREKNVGKQLSFLFNIHSPTTKKKKKESSLKYLIKKKKVQSDMSTSK